MMNLANSIDYGSQAGPEVYLHERGGRWYASSYRRVCQPWDIFDEVEVSLDSFFAADWDIARCTDDGIILFPRF
jgi:hypothetical protein